MLDQATLARTVRHAQELEEDAYYSSKSHYRAAGRYEQINFWIGIVIAVLSALLSAVAQIGDDWAKFVTSYSPAVSVLIAILASVMAFSKFGDLAAKHRESGLKFGTLRDEIRGLVLNKTTRYKDEEAALSDLARLIEAKNELNAQALHIPSWAYQAALKDRPKTVFQQNQEAERKLVILPTSNN